MAPVFVGLLGFKRKGYLCFPEAKCLQVRTLISCPDMKKLSEGQKLMKLTTFEPTRTLQQASFLGQMTEYWDSNCQLLAGSVLGAIPTRVECVNIQEAVVRVCNVHLGTHVQKRRLYGF